MKAVGFTGGIFSGHYLATANKDRHVLESSRNAYTSDGHAGSDVAALQADGVSDFKRGMRGIEIESVRSKYSI